METIFSASVVAAIVSGIVTFWATQRRISIKNITQERRDWRMKIRELAMSIHQALMDGNEMDIHRLRAELSCLLNPGDDEDNAILACLCHPNNGKGFARAEEVTQRISLLLKHDWERAKVEFGSILMRFKCIRDVLGALCYKPERTKYLKRCKCMSPNFHGDLNETV